MSELSEEFRGLFPAVITPFTSEGDLHEEAFRRVLEFNIEGGVNGFWVCGGTGESVLLEPDEVTRMAEIAVDQVQGRAKLIIHVGAITTRKAMDLAKRVHRTGADAVCAVPPFFYRTTRQGIIDHYKAVADAGDLPFFLYNLPDATGVEITPDLMEEIIDEVPQVVGLKHSAPNFFNTRSFVDMGLIIKILYFLDVMSFSAARHKKLGKDIPTEGDPDVFHDSFDRDAEIPTEMDDLDNLKNVFDKVRDTITKENKRPEFYGKITGQQQRTDIFSHPNNIKENRIKQYPEKIQKELMKYNRIEQSNEPEYYGESGDEGSDTEMEDHSIENTYSLSKFKEVV